MRIPMQSMPISNQVNYNAQVNGVEASDRCRLCKLGCNTLPDPAKRRSCLWLCDKMVC